MLLPNEDLLGSEVYGIVRPNQFVFKSEHVDRLDKARPMNLQEECIEQCYSFIDPSGGGHGSDFAIITAAIVELPHPRNPRYEKKKHVVILALSRDRNQNEIDEQTCVHRHFTHLRRLRCLKKTAVCVIFTENNFGGQAAAGRIMSYVDRDEFHPIVRVDHQFGRPGVRNDRYTKEEAVGMAIYELSNESVFFSAEMTSSTPDALPKIRTEFLEQLKRFQKKIRENRSSNGGFTYEYTGKLSSTMRDDLALGFMYNLVWISIYQKTEFYRGQSGHFNISTHLDARGPWA
jgi:hypothetical protein